MSDRAFTCGSLFSGVGGIERGLERAGMRTLWQVEESPFCLSRLALHWPDVPKHKDVRDVGSAQLAAVDLICGGFPCQDISLAGTGAGLRGRRSGLWSEFARLIREMRPRWVVIENVPALRSRGLEQILGQLLEIGYDAEWHCIPASHFGAPHRRDRLWIVAYAQHQGLQGLGTEYGLREAQTEMQASGRSWWASEPGVGRMAHELPGRVDRLKALGNAVVPLCAEYIGRLIVEADKEMRGAA